MRIKGAMEPSPGARTSLIAKNLARVVPSYFRHVAWRDFSGIVAGPAVDGCGGAGKSSLPTEETPTVLNEVSCTTSQ